MSRRVIILGSTGSIGCSALDVAAAMPDEITVVGLAAGRRWRELAEQARRFRVPAVGLFEEQHADELRRELPAGTRLYLGAEGLIQLVNQADANFVLAAIVGAAGLPATLAAVERGLDIGIANKESLVVAGEIIMPLARKRGATLIPVDSEHSAIFQALHAGAHGEVRRIYLTASGGPFRTWTAEQIAQATLSDALNHPTWSMGPKITIDSATMMNKALEVIEAHYLFDLRPDQIDVLIHPESIVHSMVEFCDGSVVAQLGAPDMRTPIQYAFTYPRRLPCPAAELSWRTVRRLNFEPPDMLRFPALELGYAAARGGGVSGAVVNAANEIAVERFRNGQIGFADITRMTRTVFERRTEIERPLLADLFAADDWARRETAAA